jgi:dolichyl-phosphate beta-glucosyltransferase
MPTPPPVTLIVPCYNEADRLDSDAFVAAVDARPHLRMLLVDDGSTDDTARVLRALCDRRPDAIAAHALAANGGKAEAVRQGVLRALEMGREDTDGARWWVGYWDADLATPFDQLDAMLEATARGPDIVLGSRVRLMGRDIRRHPQRHLLGRAFATCASLTLGLAVYDTQCGAKLIASDVAGALFDRPFTTRWIFDVEVLARFVQARGPAAAERAVIEVPLSRWEDVAGSRLKKTDFLRAPAELAGIWRRYRLR